MTKRGGARAATAGAWLLTGGMLAFILYGSLFPFEFQKLPLDVTLAQALRAALHQRAGGRGDLLANLALYMPLGFALAACAARRGALAATALAALGCTLLSAGVEAAQMFLPARTPSLWDLALNIAGGAAGALAAVLAGHGRAPAVLAERPELADRFAALLLACWLAYRLYPFVPTLNRAEWLASLRTLGAQGDLDPWRAVRLALRWLVAARMLEAARPGGAHMGLLAGVMLATLAGAVMIVDRVLTCEEVLALALALPVWLLLRRRRGTDGVLLAVMLAVVVVEGTAPWHLAEAARPFGWVPFRAVVGGKYGAAPQALLQKFFLYGGLLWLAVRAGAGLGVAAIAVAALALALGWLQTRLPGRSAEVTDALLALAAALVLLASRASLRPRDAGGRSCHTSRRW